MRSRQSTFDSVSSLWAVPWPWVSFAQLMIPKRSEEALKTTKGAGIQILHERAGVVPVAEAISMVAAEAKRPRVYIKNAFKTVYIRFGLFFMGGALAGSRFVLVVLTR
jgi:hypothetical protein